MQRITPTVSLGLTERSAELRAGVVLEKIEMPSDLLRDTANRVLETPSYRETAARVGESLRSASRGENN
ncbi:hypothetical protein ACJ7K1_00070 [Paenibacillus elgii]